jgi:hypothetical protein
MQVIHAHPDLESTSVVLMQAVVTGKSGATCFINGIPAIQTARYAASCLLAPEVGDLVLVSTNYTESGSYILSVLTKADTASGSLMMPGGGSLDANNGALAINARSVDVTGKESLRFSSARINVSALMADVRVKCLDNWFERVETQVGRAILTAKHYQLSLNRFFQRTVESYRWTEKLDETRAGRVRVRAEGAYQLQSKQASLKAKGQVRIDGESIDLG